MVVRALPDQLTDSVNINAEQISSASTRIITRGLDLVSAMDHSQQIAPTHHADSETETGTEFLITDRVFVTFKVSDRVDAD